MSFSSWLLAAVTSDDDGPRHSGRLNIVPGQQPVDAVSADEAALIGRLRAGDPQAFDTIVVDHFDAVARYTHVMLGTWEDAEDIAQEVLAWVWEHNQEWTVSGSIRAYLLTAARRRALNVLKHRHVEHRHHTLPPDGPDTALSSLIDRENTERLHAILATLPPRWREFVALRYAAELPHAEVARTLGISEAASRQLARRALEELRRAFHQR